MKILLNELDSSTKFDFCIIGAGPAGIIIAIKLAKAGKKVALLEGGGEQYTENSQNLYIGDVIGDKYFPLDSSRLRFLGGSSNHWGGWCKPLNEEDFHEKGTFSITKWPIKKSDLDSYLTEALSIVEIKHFVKDKELVDSGLKQTYFNYSDPPVHFADKYSDELGESDNITLILNANVTSFQTNDSAVTSVGIYGQNNNTIYLHANCYILSTGGIENSRLLLWGNILTNGQLIKNPKTLGKYWMEHPVFTIGEALITGNLKVDIGNRGIAFISPTRNTMQKERILNCCLRLEQVSYYGAKKILRNLACISPDLGAKALKMLDSDILCGSRLRATWEQEPVDTNRIELSDKLDRLNVPRPILFWKKNDTDLRTVRMTAEVFGQYLANRDIGRIRLDDWVIGNADYPNHDELAGYHHMGGTRMANYSDEGVVDRNCKVFGQNNLYIAGSSVFPSSGYANPTLTIIQLALRLCEHLLQKI